MGLEKYTYENLVSPCGDAETFREEPDISGWGGEFTHMEQNDGRDVIYSSNKSGQYIRVDNSDYCMDLESCR